LAACCQGNPQVLWDNEKRAVVGTWQHPANDNALCFSPDSRWLIFPESKSVLRLIRTENGSGTSTLALKDGETVTSVAFSPTGREVTCAVLREAAGRRASRIVIYEFASTKVRTVLHGHSGAAINCLAYSADGLLLASGADDTTVLIWQPGGAEPKAKRSRIRWVLCSEENPEVYLHVPAK
jgi:WD40 repeat protein